ncbi:hypothetical protein JVU11DRAFT_7816 [Chiua virens]|nr:hypothetical protein JVU11DRAFT_7816 [Chiua virens]
MHLIDVHQHPDARPWPHRPSKDGTRTPNSCNPPNKSSHRKGGRAAGPPHGGNVPFPPGYPGPPPVPAGGTAAHPSWNAGYWQYNPLANMQNPQQQPWAPAAGWFPPNFNPYKRVPKPPSPSYWNTKLTDNGLGLEGMVKRKEPSEYNGEEPQTPWIWNPSSLLESGDRATPTRDFNPRRTGSVDPNVRESSTPPREFGQSTRGLSQEGLSTQALSQTQTQTPDRRSSARAHYVYTHESAVTPTGPARHSTDPVDTRSTQSGGSFAGPSAPSHQRSLSGTEARPNRARSQPPATNEVPPYPAPTPIPNNRSVPVQQQFTQEPETFTSKGDLHPTFSSSIIRTPTHYQHARRSTEELPSSYHSRSPSSAGHASTPSRGPPAPEPLTRQSSLPTTRDVYANFTEDLTNSLSASTSSRPWPSGSATNSLSRSRTEPIVANLTTIHEGSSASSSGELYLAPLRDLTSSSSSSTESSPDPSPRRRSDREWDRERRTSPYASMSHSPEPSPLYRDRDRRPSPYASRHAAPHSHSPSPSPHARTRDPYQGGSTGVNRRADTWDHHHHNHSHSSLVHNPLPPPPVERANLEASRPPVQEASPPHYARRVRMGFWNRRGDHLTPNSYVVYAPHDRAYPEELRDYPSEREGYQDQYGSFAPWLEERPELPASLPSRGRQPAQPYDTFVVYAYLQ